MMVHEFNIGDKVRLAVGDGRIHVIKELAATKTALGWFCVARFEDDEETGLVDSSGFTDMIKVE